MAYCSNEVQALAYSIYQSIGSPTSQSVGFVSGWLMDPNNLGDLNNRLCTSFYTSGNCIVPDLGPEESDIYGQIYIWQFYNNMAVSALANGGSFWTSLTEGDTKIGRDSPVNVSKAYMALNTNAERTLRQAVHDYKLRLSVPQSVDAASLPSYPTP